MRRPKFFQLLVFLIPFMIGGNVFAQFGLDAAAEADPLVRIDAVFPTAKIVPGRTELLGVRFRIAPKWHIYWRNPGESGSEPRITLELPKGFKAGPVVWPRPVIHASEWETTFGYDGEAMLFVPITAPPEIEATTVRIGIEAEWLVCKEVCLMGSGKTSLELPVAAADEKIDAKPENPASAHARGLARIPTPFKKVSGTIAQLVLADGRPALRIEGPTGGAEKITFVPDLTPGVTLRNGVLVPATVADDRYRILVPLEIKPENSTGKPLEVAGVVLFGNKAADPAVSIRIPLKP
jgi:DsbC/DsbD-like thiol-disulfide interchange protein